MIALKNNYNRATQLITVTWVMLGVSGLMVISDLMQYQLLTSSNINIQNAEANDMRQGLVSIINLAVLIFHIVFFILWFRRAYYNIHQVKGLHPKFEESAAAYVWFIPILNLFRPYHIMIEIWEKTQISDGFDQKKSAQIIGFWWAAHITTNLLSNASFRMERGTSDINVLSTSTMLSIIAGIIAIPALYFIVQIVQQMREFEEKFYENHQGVDMSKQLIDNEL